MTTEQDQQSRAVIAAWNAQADEHNQWETLGDDEKIDWAMQAARALPAGIKPVGYLIDWPDEPDLGHYFAEGASTTGRSQPLHTAAQVQAMGHVPPGWQPVPVESTRSMKAAGRQALKGAADCTSTGQAVIVFEAMCAEAPRPPAAQELVTGPCGQCKDARQPCHCAIDTMLSERGSVAVNREHYLSLAKQAKAAQERKPLIARQLGEWHEDDGPVAWWAWCGHGWAGEPAWIGTPNSSDWPGYHTHWTPHPQLPAAHDIKAGP